MSKRNENRNRYRTLRSAILTGSLLSILPLLVLMKGGAAGTSASVNSTLSAQSVSVAGSPAQTSSSQNTVNKTVSQVTHTRTKAS
jgi:hypothetical protein